ncbi:MAG TPA: TrkA family potassium uptake protein [Egibacteraceae bacterium]|nr:TrkA family potassium uptake protein [Egibacteraceae bacterium]
MRIVIAGGGQLGRQVLSDMSEAGGHELVVIDPDQSTVGSLSDDFDALVLHGDATDPEMLRDAQIDKADAVVATTGSDALNTVVAMLAHRAKVNRIVVRLQSNALRGALEEIGVSEVVAPTMAAAARVEAALHGDPRIDVAEAVQGHLQFAEVTCGPATDARTIGDLDLPDGAMVVAVVRGDDATIGKRDVTLREGDAVILVTESEQALAAAHKAIQR